MNTKSILCTLAAASLTAASAQAGLEIRELFDGLNGSLNGSGDSTSSVGFEPGTTWLANMTDSIKVANNFNNDPAITNEMPVMLTGNGGIWWSPVSGSQWNTGWWATRQIAAGSQMNMGVDGVHYITFNLRRRSDDAGGFGFATGSTADSAFFSSGITWNNTSFFPAAARRLVIAQGTLNVGQGCYGANVYSTNAQPATDARNLILLKITTRASGSDMVQAAFFNSARAGYTALPLTEAGVTWDVAYTFSDDRLYPYLLLYMNGGTGSCEIDAFRMGTAYSDVIQLTPRITTQPNPSPTNTVYAGVSVTMSVAATGGYPDPLYYQWWKGAYPISGATNSTLLLTNTVVQDSGDYFVVVNNSYGTINSVTNTITFLPANPPVVVADVTPLAPSRYIRGSVTFNATIDGTPPFSYQWMHDGNPLAGATNTTLTISDLISANSGSYALYVTNKFGWTNTSSTVLYVLTPAAGSYAEMIITNKPLAYWRLNEGAYDGDLPPEAYEYMGGYDAFHTNTAATAGIRPPAYLGMEDANNGAYYNGTSASSTTASLMNNLGQFTLMGWFNPYVWPQVTPSGSGRVALFGQNDAAEFGFHGQNVVGMWTPGGGFVSFNGATLISAYNWYFIVAIGDGTKVTFYLNGNEAASVSQTTTNYGSSAYPFRIGYGVLDATGNEFQGLIDEVALYNRALSVAEVNAMYSKAVGVASPPSILADAQSATRYVGKSAKFTVTAAGTLPLRYQWRHNNANVAGADTNSIAFTNLTIADAGTYELVITNVAGAITSTPVTLTVVVPAAGSYEEAAIAANPTAYYRLNEAAGSTVANDLWGGFNGTVNAGATLGLSGATNPPFVGFESSNTSVGTVNGTAASYVSCPALYLSNNNVTISGWVYADSDEGGYRGIIFSRAGNTVAGLHTGGGNELRYTWNNAAETWGWASGLAVPVGEWCFVAGVIEPTKATLYVGTKSGLKSAVNNVAHTMEEFDGELRIGNDANDGTGRTWNGRVDEVMICNRALSSTEILGLYQKATGTEFKLALSPGGMIEDSKPVGASHHGKKVGSTWMDSLTDSGATPTKRTGIAQFTAATGSQIAAPASADFDSASGTICFWVLATNVPLPTPGNEGAMLVDHRTTTGAVIVLADDGSIFWQGQADAQHSFNAGYLPDGLWHHVAVTYGQTVGDTIAIYVDGALAGSVSVTNAWAWPAGQQVELGQSHDTWWKRFDGFMDDFRIYNRVLTADEIASVKASDALVDTAALKVRYNFDTAAGVGQTLTWPLGTLQSSPAVGPDAIWTPVTGATPPTYVFPLTEPTLFFRAVY